MQKHCILGYPKCAQWRFWSDCANAQSDLNLRWANISGCTFSKVSPHIIINDCFQILPSFKDGVLIQDIMPQNGGKRHLAKMSVQGDELITVSSISLQVVVLLIWAPRAEHWVRTESDLGQLWRNSVVCSKAVNENSYIPDTSRLQSLYTSDWHEIILYNLFSQFQIWERKYTNITVIELFYALSVFTRTRQPWANSKDLDQMPQNVSPDQGSHWCYSPKKVVNWTVQSLG